MKKTTLVACFLFATHFMYCQVSTPASGGEATGTGSVSYSIGQLITTTISNSNGSVSAGVQQAYEISVILGVEDTDAIELAYSVYPNPTLDVLYLSITNFNQENLIYQLFNVKGQLLASKQVSNATATIAMESYLPAIYILKVIGNNQELKTFKIIKK